MFEIVMLPTKKEAAQHHNILKCIHDSGSDRSGYNMNDLCIGSNSYSDKVWELQHLYIVSNDTIEKESNLVLCIEDWGGSHKGEIFKNQLVPEDKKSNDYLTFIKSFKNLVASTDKTLTVDLGHLCLDKLPTIPEKFIHIYTVAHDEGKPITKVELEMDSIPVDRAPGGWDTFVKVDDAGCVIIYLGTPEETFRQVYRKIPFADRISENDLMLIFKAMEKHAELKVEEAVKNYEEVIEDHKRLVRELDTIINGVGGAAKQASLCDIVSQMRTEWPKLSTNGQ